MKKYVVGILNLYDNDLQLFKVEGENKFDALKKGMIEFISEDVREYELEFQNSPVCPPTFEGLMDFYANGELMTNVIEI